MKREVSAIRRPSRPLDGFPTIPWPRGTSFFRSVSVGNGPWWFARSNQGRFNLFAPFGTCYLASDIATSIRERAGEELLHHGIVPESFVSEMEVATVATSEIVAADILNEDAVKFGCSRELATVADYGISRSWASGFKKAKIGGVWYASRFTSSKEPNSLAVFGLAGDSGVPATSRMSGTEAFEQAGMADSVVAIPSRRHIKIATRPLRQRP